MSSLKSIKGASTRKPCTPRTICSDADQTPSPTPNLPRCSRRVRDCLQQRPGHAHPVQRLPLTQGHPHGDHRRPGLQHLNHRVTAQPGTPLCMATGWYRDASVRRHGPVHSRTFLFLQNTTSRHARVTAPIAVTNATANPLQRLWQVATVHCQVFVSPMKSSPLGSDGQRQV